MTHVRVAVGANSSIVMGDNMYKADIANFLIIDRVTAQLLMKLERD